MSGADSAAGAVETVEAIARREDLTSSDKLKELLVFGNTFFKTSSGLVSRVEDSRYTVMHCASHEVEVEPGTEFALEETYCSHTLKAAGPVAFHRAGTSEISGHPCYDMFQLETYVGAPVVIDGATWGTVNFTAIEARDPFAPEDLEVMAALSTAVGQTLASADHAA
ncbi:GAF domain-containing protein [Nocardioides marinus]|nr:GAF domain-containing protein [Nocardioides marinus]